MNPRNSLDVQNWSKRPKKEKHPRNEEEFTLYFDQDFLKLENKNTLFVEIKEEKLKERDN